MTTKRTTKPKRTRTRNAWVIVDAHGDPIGWYISKAEAADECYADEGERVARATLTWEAP